MYFIIEEPSKTLFTEKPSHSPQFHESEWYNRICTTDSPMADAIMDRISYDSYKINIESIDPKRDLSMREVYGLDPKLAE